MDDVGRYAELYREWWSAVCAWAAEVLGSDAAAEDAAQRVFIALWRRGGWHLIKNPERYFRRPLATLR
jgi:DNA-directed RNA polymerase specialized sigma24 family protein